MNRFALVIVMAALLGGRTVAVGKQTTTSPIRAGDIGRALSEQDLSDLRRIVPAGASPWLLLGERGQTVTQYVQAFLQPSTTAREIRRGPAVVLRRLPSNGPTPEPWVVVDNFIGAGTNP